MEKRWIIVFKNGFDQRAFGMFSFESAEKFLKENDFQKVSQDRYELKFSEKGLISASILTLEVIFPFFRGTDGYGETVVPCPS